MDGDRIRITFEIQMWEKVVKIHMFNDLLSLRWGFGFAMIFFKLKSTKFEFSNLEQILKWNFYYLLLVYVNFTTFQMKISKLDQWDGIFLQLFFVQFHLNETIEDLLYLYRYIAYKLVMCYNISSITLIQEMVSQL